MRSHSASVVDSIGALGRDAGVGHHDVHAAESLDRSGKRLVHSGLVGDIPADRCPGFAEAVHRVRGAVSIEVERDDACAPCRELVHHGTADAARRSGNQCHLSLKLPGRGAQRELVELERPVLDREALVLGQRGEAAERVRTSHHLDGAVIEVAGQPRLLGSRPDADQAHVLDQHDARVRVCRHRLRVGVALDVGAVVVAEFGGERPYPLGQRRSVLALRVERDPQRHALRVHQMVGAGGADGDELGSVA